MTSVHLWTKSPIALPARNGASSQRACSNPIWHSSIALVANRSPAIAWRACQLNFYRKIHNPSAVCVKPEMYRALRELLQTHCRSRTPALPSLFFYLVWCTVKCRVRQMHVSSLLDRPVGAINWTICGWLRMFLCGLDRALFVVGVYN